MVRTKQEENFSNNVIWYNFILCILVMFVSGFCVNSLYRILGHFELLIKCIVDGILFCCNYFIQQKIIFRRNF